MSWADALGWTAARFREIIDRHGPDAVAFYGSGQLDTETVYLAVQAVQGATRHQQHRLEQPAVHGGRRRRLSHQPRQRRPADLLRRHRPGRRDLVIWAATWPRPIPVTFDRVKARQQGEPRRRADRRRSPPHRDRRARRPAPPGRPGGDIALLNALGRLLLEQRRRRPTTSSTAHTDGLRRATATSSWHSDWTELCRGAGVGRRRSIRTLADLIARRAGVPQLLLHGAEPEHRRHVEEQQPHQPAPADRADRQAGRRAVLADRPAQRDGRPRGGPAVAPACPAIASSRTPAHRAEVEAFWGRPAATISPEAGPDRGRDVPRPGEGPAQGDLDRRRPIPRSACPTCTRSAAPWPGPSWSSSRTPIIRPRRPSSPTSCCPRRSGARRSGPAPTASGSVATARACSTRPARRCPTGRSSPASPRRWASGLRLRRTRPRSGTSSSG